MNTNGYDIYKQNSVNTNTQGNLIIMLYEGALRFIDTAIQAIDEKDIMKANTNLIKAQDIFYELRVTLNFEQGEEIATNLERLYTYFIEQLIEANIKKDKSIAIDVRKMVNDLYLSWKEIISK
jgi:flagellar protein FliS